MDNKYDILIIGGGTSGVAAGIQAARLGAKTIIVEETPWLGGMITSAAVSAFDGNKYALGGGIFGELRKKIEDYYGGADKTFTGWISLTCFEPKKGKDFLHEIANAEKNLTFLFERKLVKVLKNGDKIIGAVVKDTNDAELEIKADITIEATEYGDVLALADVPYRLGRDSKADTLEPHAPELADGEVQDMTFCAILKKYPGKAPAVPEPKNYNPELFINSTAVDSNTTDEKYLNHKLHDWNSFISYAALPNDKYLLNWPFRSNDYPTTLEIYEDISSRPEHFRKAKELTLAYVHYMQTKLGHPEWGLATDEFPTEDNLPFIPYVRESRRVKGVRLMVEEDVVPAEGSFRPPLQRDGIAVGDYFLDHHHSAAFRAPGERLEENLPANAPFQIPLGCLIPAETEGLVVAEKSISVTHIVNGCSRLQPVSMLIGQAAGALAAIAVAKGINPREVEVEAVQNVLLKAGCQLFPYKDLWNTHPAFEAVQHLALKGIYVDSDTFEFDPEKIVTPEEAEGWQQLYGVNFIPLAGLTRAEAAIMAYESIK
jgi:hypothetical protein